jgi:hypothetical protein
MAAGEYGTGHLSFTEPELLDPVVLGQTFRVCIGVTSHYLADRDIEWGIQMIPKDIMLDFEQQLMIRDIPAWSQKTTDFTLDPKSAIDDGEKRIFLAWYLRLPAQATRTIEIPWCISTFGTQKYVELGYGATATWRELDGDWLTHNPDSTFEPPIRDRSESYNSGVIIFRKNGQAYGGQNDYLLTAFPPSYMVTHDRNPTTATPEPSELLGAAPCTDWR